ncbi:MAG: hypothetical protein KAG96_02030 [Ichthyobacteriaceae bacterium]|nr:hypothetical protein [Ichthyobacteriaceae bacterium]
MKYKYLLLLIVLFLTKIAHSETPILNIKPLKIYNDTETLSINESTIVYKSDVNYELADLLKKIENNEILPVNNLPSRGFNRSYYWVFFKLQNNSNDTEFVIRNTTTNIDEAILYNINFITDTLQYTGTNIKLKERRVKTQQIMFPINLKHKTSKTYVIKIVKLNDTLSFQLNLYNKLNYTLKDKSTNFYYAVFFVLMFVFVIMSFIMGGILKHNLFIAYGLYGITMIVLYAVYKSYAYYYFYPNAPYLNFYFKNVLFLVMASFNYFSISFLQIKVKFKVIYKWLKRITKVYIIGFIVSMALPMFFKFYIFRILYISIIIHLVGILLILIYMMIKKHKPSYVFFISFLPLLIGGLLTILSGISIISAKILYYEPTLLGTLIEFLIYMMAVLSNVNSNNKQREILLLESTGNEKMMLVAYSEGIENIRSTISEELHDNIGSRLAMLKKYNNSEIIISELNIIKDKVKSLSESLTRNTELTNSLLHNIELVVAKLNNISDINITLNSNNIDNIKGTFTLQVIRIIQEAITNAIKYSNANNITIFAQQKNNELEVVVSDDGVGFKTDKLNYNSNGIKNMKNRAEKIDGILSINSVLGKGTTVSLYSKINTYD